MIPSFEVAAYAKGDLHAEKLALFLPGLLDSKDYPHMRSHVDFFADLGFYALSIDMPGTWESGDDLMHYTTTSSLTVVNDIIAAFNRPTFVMGHSNGGRLAVLAAAQNPQVKAVACVMSAATTYTPEQTDAWRTNGVKVSFRDEPDNPAAQRRFELPFVFCKDAAQYDAPAALKTLVKPKLFVCGDEDVIVTPQEIRQTFDKSAEPKQLVTIRSDHDYRRSPVVIGQINNLMQRFLADHGFIENGKI